MKCPKCKYVSYDYLDVCRKCGVDLVAFKRDMGLVVLQPGVLDLGLVLGEAGADDLFESVEEEVTMHADTDDDFDISLDSGQVDVKRTPIGAPRAGARATEDAPTGLDHLTIELDVAAAMAGHGDSKAPGGLDHLTLELDASTPPEPSTPTAPPPAVPAANIPPAHMTIEMEPASLAIELPPGTLAEIASGPSPSDPETTASQDISLSLSLDVSSLDLAATTSATDPEESSERTQSIDAEPTESVDAGVRAADDVEAMVPLQLQDGVLADDSLVTLEEQAPESVEPSLSTIELRDDADMDAAVAQVETETRVEPSEVGGAVSATLDSFALSVDDSLFASQVDEPSGSDIAAVVEPTLSAIEEPPVEEVESLPTFELAPDMPISMTEPLLSDLTLPTLDEPTFTFPDESMLPFPPAPEVPATAETAEPLLSDLTLPTLDASTFTFPDAGMPPFPPAPEVPATAETAEPLLSDLTLPTLDEPPWTFPDAGMLSLALPPEISATAGDTAPKDVLTSSDMLALEDLTESELPGHITIELDTPELGADLRASLLEDAERTLSQGDTETTEATTSPGEAQGFTPSDAFALGALDDTTVPGHLTLELDASEITANWSASTLDEVRFDDPPSDVQSKPSTPQNEANDGEELQLDLDTFEIDDDTHA